MINSSLIALGHMSKKKGGEGGVILNIASMAGYRPLYWTPIYVATKHAILGFTRAMANDTYYSDTGVKFILICPGVTKTNLIETAFVGNGAKFLFPEFFETAIEYFKSLPSQKYEQIVSWP